MNPASPSTFDVVIGGGGPAGSTAATLLAKAGHSVLLIERDRHPRFHIGESMLPFSESIVERLGIDWSDGNQFKNGAVFLDEQTGRRMHFPLSAERRTFQIERAPFDQRLFENARSHGATTHQLEKILAVTCDETGVSVASDQAEYQTRYFIDATGRSALLGRSLGAIRRIDNLGRFAVYRHYGQLPTNAETNELFATGNIYVPVVDIGWLWIIPLAGRQLSIGLVVRDERPTGVSVEQLLDRYIAASPVLGRLLDGALPCAPTRTEADFSYTNELRYGTRFACCGDSAGFLDPVFSSGVFLAFTSAARVADRVDQALRNGTESDPGLHAGDDADYRLGFETMRAFVERFYHSDMVHNLFFAADEHPRLKAEIAQLLAGDLWTGTNPLQNSLLANRRPVG